jgi:ATP:ADP antiporter, AAA family
MHPLPWLSRSLGVHAGEGRSVGLMVAHSFAMGTATVFFETAASAMFLAQFDKQYLPWVYIAAALLNLGTGSAYSAVKDRVSFPRLMAGTLVFLLVSVVSVRVGLAFSGAAWLVFASLVWYRVLSILTDLEYWAVAARLYDVRQAKRLFGLVGSGEVVARIVGAFSVPLLLRFTSVPNLILLSAAALALCLALLLAVAPLLAEPADETGRRVGPKAVGLRAQLRETLAHPYLSLVVAIGVLAVFGKYFVDFAFLEQMRARMSDAKALAGFFAVFSGVTQGLSLLTRVFVSGPILTRLGIRVGMLVLPMTHLVCTLAIVLAGAFAAGEAAVFWLVIANQGVYKVLKHPIDNPSFKVLYQPLRRDERLAAQIAIEVIFTPVTIGIAGAIMLLMSSAVRYDPVRFAWVLLATFVVWGLLARRGGRAYAKALLEVLRRRISEDAPFGLDDATSLSVLRSKLDSPSAGEVVFALHLLERADDAMLGDALIAKLEHASPEVRRYAVERLEALGRSDALEPLRRRAGPEKAPAVKSAILKALTSLGGDAVAEEVAAFVGDPDPIVRRGAVTALLRVHVEGSRAPALSYLGRLARATAAEDRVVAAQIAGHTGLDSVLARLLDDAEPAVRRAALAAAGRVGRPERWPALVKALDDPLCSSAAAAALTSCGEAALGSLDGLLGAADHSGSTQAQVARIYGAVRGPVAVRALSAHVDHPDQLVRAQILDALAACGYRAEREEAERVARHLREAAAEVTWKLAVRRDLGAEPELAPLRGALETEVAAAQRRVFRLLSFLYDPRAITSARDHVAHPSKDKRAYALEVLDVTLEGPSKAFLLPLLDDRSAEARLEALAESFAQAALSREARIEEILTRGADRLRPWTRATAMHAVGLLRLSQLGAPLAAATAPDPILRETAAWALARLGASPPFQGEASMLLIEKVMLLKGVQMFEETSEEILTEIARILEEVEVAPGEDIFHKGDIGDSMYIVVEGQVRIYDGERTINVLGEKEIFGELALLDPEPRSASVSATQPSRLFRLDRETFSQLMAGNIEIVRGVLHVLCERLRRVTSFAVTPR